MAEGAGERPGRRVAVVLVSHSREVAEAVARLAVALAGGADPPPVLAAGGTKDGGLGTSSELIAAAAHDADRGAGVAVLADLGSAVLTVRTLAAEEDELPARTQLLDAPFVEGAIAAVATAAGGGSLAEVARAAEDAYTYRKL